MAEHEREQKLNEFEPAAYEDWLKLVERDLKGAPFDKKLVKRVAGIEVSPLYTLAERARTTDAGLPGFAPFTRGSQALGSVEGGWDVRQPIAHPDLTVAAQAVSEELLGETSSVLLRFDEATRAGSAASDRGVGQDGIVCTNLPELELLLGAIALDKTPVALDAGATTLPVAAGLIALAKKRGVDLRALSGCFGADPLGTLAMFGALPTSVDSAMHELVELASYTQANTPGVRSIAVNTAPYHDAGADAAQEIAIALATGLAYLRALTDGGMHVSDAASQLLFRFSIGRDFFLEIAKLRAARLCWTRVVSASGGDASAQAMLIHASTSQRTKTARDPWVNLLRATTESFSAAVGGADIISTGSFDETVGPSDEFARHLARNTQHLLRHEAHLHRVVDPAGGSFYLESLTDALAKKAWSKLQTIEKGGSFAQSLLEGTIQRELLQALEAEQKAVETRKIALTGVNEFPNVREAKLSRSTPDTLHLAERSADIRAKSKAALTALEAKADIKAAIHAVALDAAFLDISATWQAKRSERSAGADADHKPARAQALKRARLAEPYEALRDASDRALASRGVRPRVFLANLGPIPEHKARAQFAQNFVEAGGFEALSNDGFQTPEAAAEAFAASGAEVCALCSSDEVYASWATEAAQAIQEKGAKALLLAGNPGENEARYRAAGINDFIYMGMNVVESLRSLLERAGAV